MPSRGRSVRSLAVVGLLAALVGLVAVLQLRSQAEVQRNLAGEDPTSLAFLIDQLHRANDSLQAQVAQLSSRRDRLAGGGQAAAEPALEEERLRLRAIQGLDPVHGPGVVIRIDAPLTSLDLQDGVNNLRLAGAEAIAINDHRVITGTSIVQSGGRVLIDDSEARSPWTLQAIGDPDRLGAEAAQMTRSLQASSRVRSVDYRRDDYVQISATVRQLPFVYGRTS
jgi:uncharacterized protein YlxW (UPF0749 family)